MPPKPSQTDLELVTSDEEMELEIEPYPSDEELEVEEEKETRDSGDEEGVVDAGEFKNGKKSRRVLESNWYGPLMEVLSNDPGLLENLDIDANNTIARRLLETHKIDKTGAQIRVAIRYMQTIAQNGRVPPSLTTEKERQDYEKIAEKLASTSGVVKSGWIRYLMKELAGQPDYLQTKEKKKLREEISAALRKRDIVKTENQIKHAIKNYFYNGRNLPFPLNDEDVKNEKVLRERVAAQPLIAHWWGPLLAELSNDPELLENFDFEARKAISRRLREFHGLDKNETQISNAVCRMRKYAQRGQLPSSTTTNKERRDFEKIAAKLTSTSRLMKKTKSYPPKIRSRVPMTKVIGGRVEKKTNKQCKRRDASPIMSEDEDEEVEDEAMLSETESYAPKIGKRVPTRKVIGDRIDKKKNKRNERRNASPMLSEDDEVEKKEGEAMEQRNEEMLQELERAKEREMAEKEREMAKKEREIAEKEREIAEKEREVAKKEREMTKKEREMAEKEREIAEKERQMAEKEEILVAAEKSEKEATVDGEAQFSVLSKAEEINLPKEQRHFVTLKGMTIGTGKFLVTDLIGAGTFGVVFRAVEKKTGNVCALKILETQGNDHLIVSELKLMRRINNGGPMNKFLAPPSHSFTDMHNGVGFTAFQMDLLRVDLFSVVNYPEYENKRFPPVAVLSILGQVFSALAYMNERGLVYSDVKPDNVMLKTFDLESRGDKELIVNPEIRLIDFNAALDIDVRTERCQSARYRAPEVIFGYNFSEKIDSWSMGLLGLELLQKKLAMPIDYDEDDEVHEHIVRIEYLIDEEIPEKMWEPSRINMRELPSVPDDQMSMADILDDLEPSIASFALQHYIPRLLKIDPENRPSPAEAAEGLKDAFPHP